MFLAELYHVVKVGQFPPLEESSVLPILDFDVFIVEVEGLADGVALDPQQLFLGELGPIDLLAVVLYHILHAPALLEGFGH
jgi:hypothetical protein